MEPELSLGARLFSIKLINIGYSILGLISLYLYLSNMYKLSLTIFIIYIGITIFIFKLYRRELGDELDDELDSDYFRLEGPILLFVIGIIALIGVSTQLSGEYQSELLKIVLGREVISEHGKFEIMELMLIFTTGLIDLIYSIFTLAIISMKWMSNNKNEIITKQA